MPDQRTRRRTARRYKQAGLALIYLFLSARLAAAESVAIFEGVWLGEGYGCYVDDKLTPSVERVEISVTERRTFRVENRARALPRPGRQR